METGTVLDCGHAPTDTQGGIGTGYSIARGGFTRCYACSHAAELAAVASCKPGDLTVAYVSGDDTDWRITDWAGGVLMTRVRWGAPHNFGRRSGNGRRYVSAMDADHRIWTGVGSPGMYAVLRLTRQVVEFGPAALAKGDPRDRRGKGWHRTEHGPR